MAFRITVKDENDVILRSYTAIGNRDALMDAEYDAGALGVTVLGVPAERVL